MTLGACRGCGITTRRAGTAGGGGALTAAGATGEAIAGAGLGGAAIAGATLAGGATCVAGRGAEATAAEGAGLTTTGATTGAAGRAGATVYTGRGPVDGVTVTDVLATLTDGGAIPGRAGAEFAETTAGVAGAFAGGLAEAGATVTGGRGGGVDRATASACLRSRIAFKASPGLDTCDRLKPCRGSAEAERAPEPAGRLPRLTYPRTFSASSSSMELECVFFSATPTAVRASRMVLLFTSSSLARSLIRTLLIRSFSKKLPFAS